jgi:uncharacterized protein (TIGR02453 family)
MSLLFTQNTYTFFKNLEANNTRDWFHEHKPDFEKYVKTPIVELAREFEFQYGHAHLFRPNRDVRFSNDKSPYKTNGSFFLAQGLTGLYFSIDKNGVYVGGGIYEVASDQLLRWREHLGTKDKIITKKLIAELENFGLSTMTQNALKTAPRGFAKDHPELPLLQLKHLVFGKSLGLMTDLSAEQVTQKIKDVFDMVNKWNKHIDKIVGASKLERKW